MHSVVQKRLHLFTWGISQLYGFTDTGNESKMSQFTAQNFTSCSTFLSLSLISLYRTVKTTKPSRHSKKRKWEESSTKKSKLSEFLRGERRLLWRLQAQSRYLTIKLRHYPRTNENNHTKFTLKEVK